MKCGFVQNDKKNFAQALDILLVMLYNNIKEKGKELIL